MKKTVFIKTIILLTLFCITSIKGFTQKCFEMPLWPEKEGIEDYNEAMIKVYLPDNSNGMAVIACPGGAYSYLALEKEGSDFAPFYNAQGIALIVLKYRMPAGRNNVPLEDAAKTIYLIKEKSEEWHIDKKKIGIMGASAGGHLASTLATHFDEDTRPAFQILLYPVISMSREITHKGSFNSLLGENPDKKLIRFYSNETQVSEKTPPAFIVTSHDDGVVSSLNSIYYYTALKKNNIYSELHVYPTGGHGWALLDGFTYKKDWSEALKKWLAIIYETFKVNGIELKDNEIILTEKEDADCRKITIPYKFGRHYISVKNNTEKKRVDESFIIKRSDLKYEEKRKLPALKDKNGNWIACQVDDLDKDGEWDEWAFVYTLEAWESDTLYINWIAPQMYPVFTPRTNVRYGKMVSCGNIAILDTDVHGKYNLPRGEGYPYQTDGPAWENDKVGFRHYFDGRNVRDIFGKRTPLMVMDTVGIQSDGTPGDTYHQLHWWGRDIMSGGASLGLGGIALNIKDSLIRLGITINEITDNVDSTRYILIANGPVRSIFKLDFYGWDVGKEKVDVHETMTIWAGKYGYENVIKTSPLPKGSKLVTGIVNNLNDRPYVFEKISNYRMMSTHDRQTYDKVWYLGMSLLIDERNFVNTFDTHKNGNGITSTWCVNLKPDKKNEYHFNCYAGWELSNPCFINDKYYLDMIRGYAEELSNKLTLTIH